MIIGIIGSTAASPDDRGRFAQQIATTIPGVRDGRITMSEPVRIDGQPGYETRIDAVSGKDNTPVTIVQWLRFGGQSSLRIIGSLRRATIGRKRFRASAPCATVSSRADPFINRGPLSMIRKSRDRFSREITLDKRWTTRMIQLC